MSDNTHKKLLNVGCGARFREGWTNVDFVTTHPSVIEHNLLAGIPFPNDHFEFVYHSHVLEHFAKPDGQRFIAECFRVLKPGGVLRIAVPDLETIARAYIHELDGAWSDKADPVKRANHEWMQIMLYDQSVRNKFGGLMKEYLSKEKLTNEEFVVNFNGSEIEEIIHAYRGTAEVAESAPREEPKQPGALSRMFGTLFNSKRRREWLLRYLLGDESEALEIGRFRLQGEIHQWMYDKYALHQLLSDIGFTEIEQRTATESWLENWSSWHLDTDKNGKVYKPESLFMEGRK